MSIAKKFLQSFDLQEMGKVATNVQFFTRSTVWDFADGSTLYVQMYGASYATDAA